MQFIQEFPQIKLIKINTVDMHWSPSRAAACNKATVRIARSSHSSDKQFSSKHFARTRYPHQKSRFTEICQDTPMENMSLYSFHQV